VHGHGKAPVERWLAKASLVITPRNLNKGAAACCPSLMYTKCLPASVLKLT
jgi:hypothetical protein